MKIIPVVNCQDFSAVKERILKAQEFICDHGSENRTADPTCWVHIDVADGGFTNGYETWRNPQDIERAGFDEHLKFEIHLMLNEPELAIEQWLFKGVGRLIVHLEAAVALDTIAQQCADQGVELWLALSPETPAEKVLPYASIIGGVQVLAVHPGLAGQSMVAGMLDKVKEIRAALPDMPIEIDGGVTLATVPQCAEAGVTQAVAGSVIFGSDDPAGAYAALVAASA